MPPARATFRIGSIRGRGACPAAVAVCAVRVSVVMACSFEVVVVLVGGLVTETSGRPRSLTLRSRPWSADWSATGPSRTVVPSACRVRVMPSNQAAQRSARCPFTRISYRSGSWAGLTLVASFAVAGPPVRRRRVRCSVEHVERWPPM